MNPYVIQEPERFKGVWSREVFHNDHPLHIEIGTGKGQFLMAQAALHPEINYIGIEKYSSVLFRALEKRPSLEQDNLFFLRMDAEDTPDIFGPDEVSKIYLNFSDPWPKERHAKRRLTSREFLNRYRRFLKAGGPIEFKTDNRDLFDFSLEQIKEAGYVMDLCTFDLHRDETANVGNIMTEYEERFSRDGHPINKYIIHWEVQKMVKQVNTKEFNELIAQDKVVFADFFATWCGPCKMLAPKVEAISAMPEYADCVVFVKIDVDEEEDLAESFGIMNIPTMMIFKNGEVVKTQIGGADVPILTAMIDEVL